MNNIKLIWNRPKKAISECDQKRQSASFGQNQLLIQWRPFFWEIFSKFVENNGSISNCRSFFLWRPPQIGSKIYPTSLREVKNINREHPKFWGNTQFVLINFIIPHQNFLDPPLENRFKLFYFVPLASLRFEISWHQKMVTLQIFWRITNAMFDHRTSRCLFFKKFAKHPFLMSRMFETQACQWYGVKGIKSIFPFNGL